MSSPTQLEFNQVRDGDFTSQGELHAHLVSANNPHNVTKAQVGLSQVQNLLTNLSATAAPGLTADSSLGYSVGSFWFDVVTDRAFVCVDASVGAAVWRDISSSGVFGASYLYAEALAPAATTSTTWVNALTFTTPSVLAGTYRIAWSHEQFSSRSGIDIFRRVLLNSTAVLSESGAAIGVASRYVPISGFARATLAAGTHRIDLQHRTDPGGGTGSTVRNCRVELWRIG